MTPIKYIGQRPEYTDGTYGTYVRWTKGQTQLVPDDKAQLMLRHPDVYVKGSAKEAKDATEAVIAVKPAPDSEEDLQDARDLIATMDKDALGSYAKNNFRVDINKRQSVETLRLKVSSLVDQFGLT